MLEAEGRVGDSVRRWVLVAPDGAEETTRDEDSAQPSIRLTADRIDEAVSPYWRARSTTHLMPLAYEVPPDEVDDLDRWYAEEHMEMLLRCPDWLRVRRYAIRTVVGASWTRLVVHELSSADVLRTPEVRAAMATPWRARLAARPWFLAEGRDALAIRRRHDTFR